MTHNSNLSIELNSGDNNLDSLWYNIAYHARYNCVFRNDQIKVVADIRNVLEKYPNYRELIIEKLKQNLRFHLPEKERDIMDVEEEYRSAEQYFIASDLGTKKILDWVESGLGDFEENPKGTKDSENIINKNSQSEQNKDNLKSIEFKKLEDLFLGENWEKYIDLLTNCKPPLLKKENGKYTFIGNQKTVKGCVAQWMKFLKSKRVLSQSLNRDEIANILSNEISNYSINGSSIDNESKKYKRTFQSHLEEEYAKIN